MNYNMENIIEIKNLSKEYRVYHSAKGGLADSIKLLINRKYNIIKALDQIDLCIKKGEIHALIGPNGSGKSTIIKILSGILFPTTGEVKVMGYTPWQDRENYVKKIGVLFGQKTQLSWELPAIDTYLLHQKLYGIEEKRFKANLEYFLEIFDLKSIAFKPVRNLSLGERMKCEITCIMLHEPELIFLDEPTIGLDVIAKDTVRKMIQKINQEKNVTIILTTHDMADIENLCNKVTIINQGIKVFDDTLERLIKTHGSHKTIFLKFKEQISDAQKSKFNLETLSYYTAKTEVSSATDDVRKTLNILLDELPIDDFDVRSTEVESIIRNIYKDSSKKTAK